jgi:hypothetical protein
MLVPAVTDQSSAGGVGGWDEDARAQLQATIAARQPFIDFNFSRISTDGTRQTFRVSGEPMFNQSSCFVGYRGIGVEVIGQG